MKKFVLVTSIVVLAVVMATMFMACTPSEESLKEKLEKEDYLVISGNAKDFGVEEGATVKYVLVATKLTKNVMVICFEKSEDAKEFYDKLVGDNKYESVKKKGNAIAFGDEESLKLV